MIILCTPNERVETGFKIQRRNWKAYSTEGLIQSPNQVKWETEIESIQEIWNSYEQEILTIVDKIAPLEEVENTIRRKVSKIMKSKLNQRSHLLKNENTTLKQKTKRKNLKP